MKFTDEDLMKAMGLQVGDRVKIFIIDKEFVYDIRLDNKNEPYLFSKKNLIGLIDFRDFIGFDYEILPRPKRVGDLKCDDFECSKCPLQYICSFNNLSFASNSNLFDILEIFKCDDQEIYDLLKARLDKEVLEDE